MASKYRHRRTFFIPAAQRDAVNAILERHGYGPDFFSVPMQQGVSPIVTHYGCHCQMDDVMLKLVRQAGQGRNMKEHDRPFKDAAAAEGYRRKRDSILPL